MWVGRWVEFQIQPGFYFGFKIMNSVHVGR